MIYDTAEISDFHGYCYQFDPLTLGLQVGTFVDPLSTM